LWKVASIGFHCGLRRVESDLNLLDPCRSLITFRPAHIRRKTQGVGRDHGVRIAEGLAEQGKLD
jgi:hypothetical protein